MAVINLGNLKFTWKGTWATNTAYARDDIVRYGGSAYVCVTAHTSGVTYAANSSKFELMASGIEYAGIYNPSTLYQTNDIISYGGATYVALQESTGRSPGSNPTYWSSLVGGIAFIGTYSNSTAYVKGDIVTYGGNNYIVILDTIGNLPTNATYWKLFNQGFSLQGAYNASTGYKPGEVATYGANVYICTATANAGISPSNGAFWTKLTSGLLPQGIYSDVVVYKPGDVVQYGGYLYTCFVYSPGNNNPSDIGYWIQTSTGFIWSGTYNSATTYQKGEVVNYNGSSFVSISFANTNKQPDSNADKWSLMMQGSANNVYTTAGDIAYRNQSAIVRLPIGTSGQVLSIDNASGLPIWENNGYAAKVYYVSPNGVDAPGYGTTLQRPFASLQYATQNVQTPSTIFVKAGDYYEQLPITVPANCAIVGDSLRNTFINPKATGQSLDASPVANNRSTMFLLSDGSLLKQMSFKGMTGFALSGTDVQDITTATIGGVFVRLNPASPILNKSPYVTDCSCFSTGGVGVIVDGSVHTSGNKSMVFHAFTNINDLGVGFWMKDNAKAEIVSCFTYYCHFGYATSGGAKIRSLNGNNSYGTYGVVSRGYDVTETPITATIYGDQLIYNSNSLAGNGFSTADTITGLTSGARGTITNVQPGVYKVYYKKITGNFISGETITGSVTGSSAVISSGGATGQKGFVVIVTGLTSQPIVGTSIEFTGDTSAYVIQTVGTYVNSSSVVQIVMAQEKVTASGDGVAVRVRANFSNARLTGHDFLSIGTGGTVTTNYPGYPTQSAAPGNQTVEVFPGRVFYISTDQDGNFKVGNYFAVNQATGTATLNASAFNLSGLSALRLGSIGAQLGELISEFSSDPTLGAAANTKVPTQYAVKTYVDTKVANSFPSYLKVGTTPTSTVGIYAANGSDAGTGSLTDIINVTVAGNRVAQFTTNGFTVTPGGSNGFEAARYYVQIPAGSTSDRPGTPSAGYMRYNTDLLSFEGYSSGQWTSVGGGNPWTIKSSNYSAVNNDRLFVDTTSGAVTITLPASPSIGDTIRIIDLAGKFNTNNLTVARNGSPIMGDAQNMTVNTKNAGFTLIYSNSTYGWRLGEA